MTALDILDRIVIGDVQKGDYIDKDHFGVWRNKHRCVIVTSDPSDEQDGEFITTELNFFS